MTNELRKLIQSKLKTVCDNVFYEIADNKMIYPHCVFSFRSVDTSDFAFARKDIRCDIDIWDKGNDATQIEDLADSIESLFNAKNIPQDEILPTFFLDRRISVLDEDKDIRHRVIRLTIQNYERG